MWLNCGGSDYVTFGAIHELGHSLGLAHAQSLRLGGRNGKTGVSKRNRFNYGADPYRNQVQEGLASGVLNQFKGEIGSLRSAAVGAIVTALWEIAKQSLSTPNGQTARHEVSPPKQHRGKIGATE